MDILKLRVLRKMDEYDKAISWGRQIAQMPTMLEHPLARIQCSIALGHALYDRWEATGEREDLTEASNWFSIARDLSEHNPRFFAICNLHLARTAKALGRRDNAEGHFLEWRRLSQLVEPRWIHKFANSVQTDLARPPAEVFEITPEKLPPGEVYRRLRKRA